MKRQVLIMIAIGVISYFIFLFATIPASFAFSRLAETSLQLRYGTASGTIWKGEVNNLDVSGLRVSRAHWDMHAWRLMLAQLSVNVGLNIDRSVANANITLPFFGNTMVKDVRAAFPLQTLSQFGYLPGNTASGDLAVRLDELILEEYRPVSAQGEITLNNLVLNVAGNMPLGNFRAVISSESGSIRAAVNDTQGPLNLQAMFSLSPEGNYDIDGTVSLRDTTQQDLARGLGLVGQADATGAHQIQFSGQL